MPSRPTSSDPSHAGGGNGSGGSASPEAPVEMEALASYYARAYPLLWRHARMMVGSADTAHEVVQEAFTVTAERIARGTQITHLGAWLRIVIRNQCTHHLRQPHLVSIDEDLDLPQGDTPGELVEAREHCQRVYDALDTMSHAQRSAFLLAEVRGLNYHEIADNLGRTDNAVRQLLARARKYVRDAVGPDVVPVATPAVQLGIGERLGYRDRFAALREHLWAKLTDLHAHGAAIAQHSAEVAAQPATAVAVGVLALAAVAPPSSNQPPAVRAAPGDPGLAASPTPGQAAPTSETSARSPEPRAHHLESAVAGVAPEGATGAAERRLRGEARPRENGSPGRTQVEAWRATQPAADAASRGQSGTSTIASVTAAATSAASAVPPRRTPPSQTEDGDPYRARDDASGSTPPVAPVDRSLADRLRDALTEPEDEGEVEDDTAPPPAEQPPQDGNATGEQTGSGETSGSPPPDPPPCRRAAMQKVQDVLSC